MPDRIRHLNLDGNHLTDAGVSPLIQWISSLNMRCLLEELSLSDNNLTDQLVVDLTEAMTRTSLPLKTLNLSRNQVGDRGAVALAEFLGGHYHLREVRVGWNRIGWRGGIALADGLKENLKIVFFDGSFN